MDNPGHDILPTGKDTIAQTPFLALTWVFFALCIVAFAVRAYIRYVSFRRLLLEDYLMLFALALHSAEAVLIQIYLHYAYDLEAVENGDLSRMGPDFFPNSKKAFVALGASVNLTIVGVLMVKLNFLFFFKRLGDAFRFFAIVWWSITVFTVASAIVQIGMQQFGCFFGTIDYIFSAHCTDDAGLKRIFTNAIFSATVDAVSDFLIVGIPIWILWGTRIGLGKKILLSFVFGLVFLTIAITIVRGSIFHQVYSASSTGVQQIQNMSFTWFWFYTELSVAFVIACIVSFRTLFVQRANKSSAQREQQRRREESHRGAIRRGRGLRARAKQLHESLIDTCKDLEGWPSSDAETFTVNSRSLPPVASGLMTVDFNDDNSWARSKMTTPTMTTISKEDPEDVKAPIGQRPESRRNMPQTPDAVVVKHDAGAAQ